MVEPVLQEHLLSPATINGAIWRYSREHPKLFHFHSQLELLLVKRGWTLERTGNRLERVHARQMIWHLPGIPHLQVEASPDLDLRVVHFEPHLVENLRDLFLPRRRAPGGRAEYARLRPLARSMRRHQRPIRARIDRSDFRAHGCARARGGGHPLRARRPAPKLSGRARLWVAPHRTLARSRRRVPQTRRERRLLVAPVPLGARSELPGPAFTPAPDSLRHRGDAHANELARCRARGGLRELLAVPPRLLPSGRQPSSKVPDRRRTEPSSARPRLGHQMRRRAGLHALGCRYGKARHRVARSGVDALRLRLRSVDPERHRARGNHRHHLL